MNFKINLLLAVISVVYVQGVTVEEEAKNSTTFTIDLYRSLFNENVNTVVSPISFRILLSLLYQSTTGSTERELKNHVYFSDNKDETALSQLQTLDQLIANPNVKIVNRVYVKKGLQLKPSFLRKTVHYHSRVEQKDFTKSQQTADEINLFVEQQTNNLIKNLVSPELFDDNTVMLLLNTLYFKAKWETQFEAYKRTDIFHGIDGQDSETSFMYSERTYNYYNSPELKALTLELQYEENSNAKFWAILPNEDSNINELKNKLNANVMNDIKSKFVSTFNRIYIPSFEIESETDGNHELKKLGLVSLFDRAEISALRGGLKLQVSDAKQKAKIIVNTEGTEAAAATYFGIVAISAPYFRDPPLVFDRPFIYMILTADTTEPLFIGHFSKP